MKTTKEEKEQFNFQSIISLMKYGKLDEIKDKLFKNKPKNDKK